MTPFVIGFLVAWFLFGGFSFMLISDDFYEWRGLSVGTTATLSWAFFPIAFVIMLYSLLKFIVTGVATALNEAFGEVFTKMVDRVEERL